MKPKKFDYADVPVPLSYRGDETPSIHRIVDLINNKELSGWRFVRALNFAVDKKTGFSRPTEIRFCRRKHGNLRTTLFDYMAVTVQDDGLVPDPNGGWEKIGVIEHDALNHPRTILFRKETKEP